MRKKVLLAMWALAVFGHAGLKADTDPLITFLPHIVYSEHVTMGEYMFPDDVVINDVDKDGDLDVIVAYCTDQIVWWRNDDLVFMPVRIPFKEDPIRVRVLDIDRDGDNDIVGLATGLPFDHLEPGYVTWWENDGQMNFTRHDIDHELYNPFDMEVADMDGDGDYDIVVGMHYFSNKLYLFENDGGMNFGRKVLGSMNVYGIWDIELADMDRDGDPDVLFGAEFPPQVGWWENDGETEYVLHPIINVSTDVYTSCCKLKAIDYESDGDIDILAEMDGINADFVLFDNDGNLNYSMRKLKKKLSMEILTIDYNDIDEDNDNDIILGLNSGVGDKDPRSVVIWENDGDFNWTERTVVENLEWGGGSYIGDMDGDGRKDLVIFDSFGDWGWWENQSNVGIRLSMPDQAIGIGEEVRVEGEVYNSDIFGVDGLPGYVMLAVGENYYFYPDWGPAPVSAIYNLPAGESERMDVIPSFIYEGGAGGLGDIYLMTAFLKPDFSELYGNIHYIDFRFEE